MTRRAPSAPFVGVAVLLAVSIPSRCGEAPDSGRSPGNASVEKMAMGSDLLDPGGLAPAAGISIGLRPAIDPLEPGALDGDTTSPGYRSFRQRCGGCHVAPSPSGKRPSEWPSVVRRMGSYVEEAGLLPVGDEERAAILEFLDRHGRPRR